MTQPSIKPTPEEMGKELLTELSKLPEYCDVQKVMAFIAAGARLNVRENHLGYTPLMNAAGKAHLECLKALLKAGADIRETDCNGNSSLMIAATNSRVECMQILIDAGINLEQKNANGYTALIQLASRRCLEGIHILIAAGADVCAQTNSGSTARDHALRDGYREIAQILAEAEFRQTQKAALEVKIAAEKAKKEFLDNTDFHKGLANSMRIPKQIRIAP